jgi:DNA-binding MarR family transcriptional regulator
VAKGLQAEIRQTKPFGSAAEEAYLNLLRTTDALVRSEVQFLRGYDLSPSQYNALRILRGAGEDGVTCGEMSERLLTRDPDVTRLIDRLERRELIQRARADQDRRVVRTKITSQGLKLLAEIDGPAKAWVHAHLGHLSAAQLRTLIELMELLREVAPDGD